ncbi:GNAT family N-acetyltransferase [Roseateles chitosanitabidus]|uniref:GNAT family N-acetyltransferase n=1 Tax=Roseateles chitosanitabidus TaxID=65048 RepID=UPI0011E047AA|nr:GNAT family N-acetyltransferase [Roseateles chitosanitabidus]MBO9685122.1 GNAT family N-acetyltransferase [Roseateles chitosanitabidus]
MTWTLHPLPDADAFAPHAAAWDALQARVAGLPFLESGFLLPLLRVFGTGAERLALHGDPRAPDAAAIVVKGGNGQWTTFQPSQLPLGAWLSAPGAALAPLAASLLRALPFPTLGLGLTQIDSRFHPRDADSPRWRGQDYIDTAWVDLEGEFDLYWEARGKNLRQNLRKQQKKLDTAGTVTRMDCLTRPEDVAPALADYGRLEASGWKGQEGTAIAPGHPQYEFYLAMLEHFASKGRARIYTYRFDDVVVSMDLCIESGATLVILKTAYDEAHKAVSPSTLMRQLQFQQLFDAAAAGGPLRRIEFYGKVMEWHTRWTDTRRPIYHATLYRWGWLPALKRLLRGAPADETPAEAPAAADASALPAAPAGPTPGAADAAAGATPVTATPGARAEVQGASR